VNTAQSPSAAWWRDDRQSFWLAGAMWVLIVLMIVPDGFDYESLTTTGAPSSGSTFSRLQWLALLSLSTLIVLWRGGLAWLLARTMNVFLLLFVVLAVASVVWSIDPSLTARRIFRMGTIVLTCAAFVLMGWHARRYQNVVRPILTLVLLGSIVFGLVFPALAIHQESAAELVGAWRGLATHKNGLGALSCFALIFWFHAALTGEVKIAPALAGCVVAVTTLLLSRSSTALAVTVFAMILLAILLRAPQGVRSFVPLCLTILVGVLLLYTLALLNVIPGLNTLLAPLTALTDKDMTLTGRTNIWWILNEHIDNRPLLGTGYGAYWTAGPVVGTDSYEFVVRMNGFYPGSAHSGYFEVVNDLGWIGFSCLIAYMVVFFRQALLLLEIDRNQGALYLTLFFQQAITNYSETHWLSVTSVDFVVMTLATMALARGLLEHRLRQVFGEPQRIVGTPVSSRFLTAGTP